MKGFGEKSSKTLSNLDKFYRRGSQLPLKELFLKKIAFPDMGQWTSVKRVSQLPTTELFF